MPGKGVEAGEDELSVWRDQLALKLLRALVVVFVLGVVVIGVALRAYRQRQEMMAIMAAGAGLLAVAAVTGRPRGLGRRFLIVITIITAAISGYAVIGFLSGPGVVLMTALMLTGLLLGRGAMVGLTIVSALVLTALGWAMVHGHLAAPDARDIAMTSGVAWFRSMAVTYLAVIVFGGLIVSLVTRMEDALRVARAETSRRERAERERAEAQIGALEAQQLEVVGRLAAGIAHDFNNNLTVIASCAELLKVEAGGSEGVRELVDDIIRSSQRSAELTRQLLAYSRKAQMLQTPTDLHEVVGRSVSLLRRSVSADIRIVTTLLAPDHVVIADATLMQSAIMNLLVNACDAMPNGGTLTIASTTVARDHQEDGAPVGTRPWIVLEIADTGLGISKELLPRIFDPFFTTKPVGKGTGLGLAAVAGTIKAHGGHIDVESEAGARTVFRLSFPAVEPAGAHPLPSGTSAVGGHEEVLLVDDDAMVGAAAVATLRSLGYRVTAVSDGQSALAAVRRAPERFQIVILDLRMPGMNGESTFDALRAEAPALPILLWSGYAAEQDVASMLRRGAAGFVQKPYSIAELGGAIAKALRR